jgi:hypothetical protein
MDYCPVLIKISDEMRTKFYEESGFRYLLQVWNRDNEKIYERKLKGTLRKIYNDV